MKFFFYICINKPSTALTYTSHYIKAAYTFKNKHYYFNMKVSTIFSVSLIAGALAAPAVVTVTKEAPPARVTVQAVVNVEDGEDNHPYQHWRRRLKPNPRRRPSQHHLLI